MQAHTLDLCMDTVPCHKIHQCIIYKGSILACSKRNAVQSTNICHKTQAPGNVVRMRVLTGTGQRSSLQSTDRKNAQFSLGETFARCTSCEKIPEGGPEYHSECPTSYCHSGRFLEPAPPRKYHKPQKPMADKQTATLEVFLIYQTVTWAYNAPRLKKAVLTLLVLPIHRSSKSQVDLVGHRPHSQLHLFIQDC